MKTKMKKKCVKILTVIICIITLVTAFIVPIAAYEDIGYTQYPDRYTYQDGNSDGTKIQLVACGEWSNPNCFNADTGDISMHFKCPDNKKMYITFDTDNAVSYYPCTTYSFTDLEMVCRYVTHDESPTVDVYLTIYLDGEIFLVLNRCESSNFGFDTLAVLYYQNNTTAIWTGVETFNMTLHLNYAWLVDYTSESGANLFDYFDSISSISPQTWMTGYHVGYANGWDVGYEEGEEDGYTNGYGVGYESGYMVGNEEGYSDGYDYGYSDGVSAGWENGHQYGYKKGWDNGFGAGQNDMAKTNETFKDMVFAIFDAPSVLIDGMLNFNIFGINLAGLVKTIITLAVVAVIVFAILKFTKG